MRYGRVYMVLARFVPGFGILVPPLAACIRVSPLKFLLLDACGALAWAGSHPLLGYLFRKNLEILACMCAKAGVLVAESIVGAVALVVKIRSFRVHLLTEAPGRREWRSVKPGSIEIDRRLDDALGPMKRDRGPTGGRS